MIMTFPEKVNAKNLAKLQRLVVNGAKTWPGANYVEIQGEDADNAKTKKSLLYGDRARLSKELRVGDVVERHMEDGDVVLFNRQPSLHKLSIMSHEVKVMPWRTFRFNECVCAPRDAGREEGDSTSLQRARSNAREVKHGTLRVRPERRSLVQVENDRDTRS